MRMLQKIIYQELFRAIVSSFMDVESKVISTLESATLISSAGLVIKDRDLIMMSMYLR